MNTKIIETGRDLEIAVLEAFKHCKEPGFRIVAEDSKPWDFIVAAELDGIQRRFAVDCKLRPSARDIESLSKKRDLDTAPILATVKITENLVGHCRRLGVSCLDLNGRIWLRAPGILVDRPPSRPDIYRTEEPPVNFFSLKSSRLSRALLSFPSRQWTQPELADLTGLSQGLLSRLLKYAGLQGWIEGTRSNWTVIDSVGLLDAWKDADVWDRRGVVRQYSVLERNTEEIASRLLERTTGQVAFTQWFAASHRFPYADTQVVSAYLAEAPSDALVDSLGAREVSGGGKLWLITPRDAGVFQAIRRVDGFPIVCDVQIYLDLLQVGLRGADQAEALRSWEGFCKP
jgi:hypothetical protein